MKIDVLDQQDLERTREVCQKLFHENYITEYVFAPNDALKQANEDYSFIMAHYQALKNCWIAAAGSFAMTQGPVFST